jgi:hypothetical protein
MPWYMRPIVPHYRMNPTPQFQIFPVSNFGCIDEAWRQRMFNILQVVTWQVPQWDAYTYLRIVFGHHLACLRLLCLYCCLCFTQKQRKLDLAPPWYFCLASLPLVYPFLCVSPSVSVSGLHPLTFIHSFPSLYLLYNCPSSSEAWTPPPSSLHSPTPFLQSPEVE